MADSSEIIRHAQDSDHFVLPFGSEIHIPQPLAALGFHVTKFMVLELAAAILMVAIFMPLSRQMARGHPPRGRFWNYGVEADLYPRRGRPALDRQPRCRSLLIVIVHVFFFILLLNLMGLVPWLGSPTASWRDRGLGAGGLRTMLGRHEKFGPMDIWTGRFPPWTCLDMAVLLSPWSSCRGVGHGHPLHLAVRLFGQHVRRSSGARHNRRIHPCGGRP